jgi:RNA polymerase sigma-70 factor (ECF subfamily)
MSDYIDGELAVRQQRRLEAHVRTPVIGFGAGCQASDDACARFASSKLTVSAPVARSDEGALVERSQAGDRLAFEELVRRHADRLYAVMLRFVADADEAEEVTQEAFLRAWRSIDKFELRSRFFTWLYRIGINEAKRRAERRPPAGAVGSIEDSPIEDAPDWSEAPEFRAEQGDLRSVLEDAVRALPIEYRAPLILRDVEGLSTQEAAEVMELREAAFKSRLHRARLAVRRAVDQYYLESER